MGVEVPREGKRALVKEASNAILSTSVLNIFFLIFFADFQFDVGFEFKVYVMDAWVSGYS